VYTVHVYTHCRSAKRRVLLPKPSTVYPPTSTAISTPSQPHLLPPSQGTLFTGAPSVTPTTITPTPPPPSPYIITQNTSSAGFMGSTRFPAPVPVQNTVIVQQGGQSVYVQQQVYQDGCQTTIMPTHYLPSPAQPFMIPPSSLQAQPLQPPTLHPLSFQPAHPQAPPTFTQIPVQQLLSSYPHIPTLPTLPILPTLPPQIPPTGFIRPVFTQHIAVAPPTCQSTLTPATSLPLPPPPPSDSGLPHNWKTAKDPQV
jgi:hypothetical protein